MDDNKPSAPSYETVLEDKIEKLEDENKQLKKQVQPPSASQGPKVYIERKCGKKTVTI